MIIRSYCREDKASVLELLQKNTPDFFDPSEASIFAQYLDAHVEDYFVCADGENILAAGGINYFKAQKHARISWDMVHPAYQGCGIGKQLLQFRLNILHKDSQVHYIVVRTTQLVYPFYAKMGFELKFVEKHFWAQDIHLYQMHLQSEF